IGVWQGRLPSALFTVATMWLLTALAARLFSQLASGLTLVAALLLHPLLLGRQVYAEMPMLCFLLGGFLLLATRRASTASIVGVTLLWSVALVTKLQALPFLAVAMVVAAGDALIRRERRLAIMSIGALIAATLLSQIAVMVFAQQRALPGLYSVTAFVP